MSNQPIEFGKEKLSGEQEQAYRQKIEEAKKKGGVNSLKGLNREEEARPAMPDFNALRSERESRHQQASSRTEGGGVQARPAGSPLLSAETEQQLRDLQHMSKEETKKEAEKPAEEEEKPESIFDMLNQDEFRANEIERILNNKERRIAIESRCKPMSFEDLLYKNEVSQRVPIKPGIFEPTFRSFTPEESLFVKKFIAAEQAISDQYIMEKYNICLLTCSLLAINGNALPDHRKDDGSPDKELFEKKLKYVMKMSGYVTADLNINYVWFDIRVRKLISADGLKNG